MPRPLCRICQHSNAVHDHGLCYGCWSPEAKRAWAIELIRIGQLWKGLRELRHAWHCLRVRKQAHGQ